jgi:hypothetical protein
VDTYSLIIIIYFYDFDLPLYKVGLIIFIVTFQHLFLKFFHLIEQSSFFYIIIVVSKLEYVSLG